MMENMADDVTVGNEVKPEGADFFVPLPNGEPIWFKDLALGQRLMLQRSGQQMGKRIEDIEGGQGTKLEKIKARQEIIDVGNRRLWDAIDSSMIFPTDVDKVMDAMISGDIDIDWAWKVFARGQEPPADDDVEDRPPSKPSRRANAKRTQVR
jgi:hypothetical protein